MTYPSQNPYGPPPPPPMGSYPVPPGPPPKKSNTGLIVTLSIVAAVVVVCCGSFTISAVTTEAPNTRSATQTPPTTESTEVETEPTTQAPEKPKKLTFKDVSARQWKKVGKNPDAYSGNGYIIFGHVMQFDSVTGPSTFLANTGGDRAEWYDYNVLAILDGDSLDDVVEGDMFKAKVEVLGSQEYETAIGGTNNVPRLLIHSIEVL